MNIRTSCVLKALKLAFAPTLIIYLLLSMGYFSFTESLKFLMAKNILSVIIRIFIFILEGVVLVNLYWYYERKEIQEEKILEMKKEEEERLLREKKQEEEAEKSILDNSGFKRVRDNDYIRDLFDNRSFDDSFIIKTINNNCVILKRTR